MYTAVKEISHMLSVHVIWVKVCRVQSASSNTVIVKIVIMNLVFSFDSILSFAITDVFLVLATAIVASGWPCFSSYVVSDFLRKIDSMKCWACLSC